jgi:hypothetical protein
MDAMMTFYQVIIPWKEEILPEPEKAVGPMNIT